MSVRGPIVVTGTDTGVGKTVVTAAIAAAAGGAGLTVAVLKPAQTGDESDVDTVVGLAGPRSTRVLASYPDPLAPATAARVAGLAPLPLDDVVSAVAELAADHDLVLVEGAGGLLVPMGTEGPDAGGVWTEERPERSDQSDEGRRRPVGSGARASGASASGRSWTVADLARRLGAPAVVVVRAGLGTLNHTALTLEALRRRDVVPLVVIGAWPAQPELVHHTNMTDLPALAGVVPDGAGQLTRDQFSTRAPSWLAPELFGTFRPDVP